MTQQERDEVYKALANWWGSQDIAPEDATFLMVSMAGIITGGLIARDEEALERGLDILVEVLKATAYKALRRTK